MCVSKDRSNPGYEHRRFNEPISIEEFSSLANAIDIPVAGFALQYDVDTQDGPQVVTIGLVPEGGQLVPIQTLSEVIDGLPDDYKVQKLLGVASYYFESSGEK